MQNPQLQQILKEARSGLARVLGKRLHSLLLYGSQARQSAHAGSDIDLVIVVRGAFDYGQLIEETSPIVTALSLEYDVVISRAFISQERLEREGSPFVLNLRREGIAV